MKALLLSALLLTGLVRTGVAQIPADPASGMIVYTGRIVLPVGVTRAQAFSRAKAWFKDAFAGRRIAIANPTDGVLSKGGVVGVGQFLYTFRASLEIEPHGVHYRLENFRWSSPSGHGTLEEQRAAGGMEVVTTELDAQVRAELAALTKELAGYHQAIKP